MAHIIEPASSGRAKCRGCGKPIGKDTLRFGERLPNPFADESEMTLWFHLNCAAYKRPESLQEVIDSAELANRSELDNIIATGLAFHRVQRINGVEQAPSGRARCRACQEMIAKGAWRIPLVYFEEGMFNASGTIHVGCAGDYFETTEVLERLLFFSAGLDAEAVAQVQDALD